MSIEAMKLALEALDCIYSPLHVREINKVGAAMLTLRQAIEQAEKQEPVATLDELEQEIYENTRRFVSRDVMEWMLKRYYISPPPRQPLTNEIKDAFYEGFTSVETYNDTNLVDVDDAWKKYKAAHGIKVEA